MADYAFIDIEAVLIARLTTLAPASVATPYDPQGTYAWLPFLRVQRVPGGGDDLLTDTAQIDIDAFAGTRVAARALSEQVRTSIRNLRGQAIGGLRIDQTKTTMPPVWMSWGNDTKVHRYVASYEISSRIAAQ